ncbi:hypothetical protein BB559_006140 [Furculomyces boomerangus]|uniref:Uncharacterized protein n=1 Tax=Furculomyces boomerangus TaxID=61424 RepID=A0A2T9Y4R1_9FUNG|nr:hypothetical protein BB559_006140 [Furculomyces boomerangus]
MNTTNLVGQEPPHTGITKESFNNVVRKGIRINGLKNGQTKNNPRSKVSNPDEDIIRKNARYMSIKHIADKSPKTTEYVMYHAGGPKILACNI